MKNCTSCKKEMESMETKTPEGVSYMYFKCSCGEEIVDMKQLHKVTQRYREMKKFHTKISKWGRSSGLRIPKELVEKYNFENNEEVTLIPEDKGIRIVPSNYFFD